MKTTFYLFDIYTGCWRSHINTELETEFPRAEQMLVQRIEMELTPANVLWLANTQFVSRNDYTVPVDAPEGVVVSVMEFELRWRQK